MSRVVALDLGIADAVAVLRSGGLLIHPTETVYGIGCALSVARETGGRLHAAKGSAPGRPYLLVAAEPEQAFALWSELPAPARALAEAWWPGPLSLVGPARVGLPDPVLGGGEVPTVGVRVPSHAGLLRLLAALGEPMLSTSANLSGRPPSVHLPVDLLGADLALDGGLCPGGSPSTILSLLSDPPVLLRPGPISWPDPR